MKKIVLLAVLMTGIAATSFARNDMQGKKAEKKEVKMDKKEMKGKPAKASKKEGKEDKKESKAK